MMKFTTYKIGPNSFRGGWYWQVTKEVGPATFVIARSGHGYATEDYAIAGYKEFAEWAGGSGTGEPPPITDTKKT
jgi:hypothetical protein